MKKLFCFLLLTCACIIWGASPVCVSGSTDLETMVFSNEPPAARTGATLVLQYDPYAGRNSNRAYLYGGKGKNAQNEEIFLDIKGSMHSIRFVSRDKNQQNKYEFVWNDYKTDWFLLPGNCKGPMQTIDDYPPSGRFAHSAIIIPSIEGSIYPDKETLAASENERINYLVFGGKRQRLRTSEKLIIDENNNWEVTNELYVNAEYGMENEKRFHWYKITPDPEDPWPSARCHTQMVPLFSEETEVEDGEYQFLVFGGQHTDSQGGNPVIRQDGFVGTFTRELTPDEFYQWDFDLCITVDFEELGTDSVFTVYGAGVVFDPYYGTDINGNRMPRVIVVGGRRSFGGSPDCRKVISIYPTKTGDTYDWTSPVFVDSLPDLPVEDDCRIHSSVVLNPRTHTLRIIGGETESGVLTPGILELDLTDPFAEWTYVDTEFEASGHNALYSNGTRIFLEQNDDTVMLWDMNEATVDPPDEPFIWDVYPDSPYGLNNLKTLLNTTRLHSYDTVRIHQTLDTQHKVNDCYRGNIVVPTWIDDITLEGVVKNGAKPVLYNLYSDNSELPNTVIPHKSKLGITLYCGGSITVRNILFCQSDDELDPSDPLPTTIPEAVLGKYIGNRDEPSEEMRLFLKRYYNADDEIWDLATHHNNDPALWIHTWILIENCEFICNGIGNVILCVSSSYVPSEVVHSVYENNFIGILSLEKEHHLAYNQFRNNYLAGVAFDKGSRSICRDNLFDGNGHGLSSSMDDYMGAAVSYFCVTGGVPNIQTPLIYNNTFIDNKRAFLSSEPGYRSQFMNRPFVFNNIVSGSEEPIWFDDSGRCDAILYANCFDPAGSPGILDTTAPLLSGLDIHLNPDFANSYNYRLACESPCVNAGLLALNPGVMSEMNYADYGQMDIGFHQLPGTGQLPGKPDNLQISGTTLTWDVLNPYTGSFLILAETDDQERVLTVYKDNLSVFEYSFADLATTYDHLYFWVFSHYNRLVYSDPVMIEWLEE